MVATSKKVEGAAARRALRAFVGHCRTGALDAALLAIGEYICLRPERAAPARRWLVRAFGDQMRALLAERGWTLVEASVRTRSGFWCRYQWPGMGETTRSLYGATWEEWLAAWAELVSPLRPPAVGDGLTYSVGSDRYACTVRAISKSGKTITVADDTWRVVGGSILDGSAQYECTPNPEAHAVRARWSDRYGCYVRGRRVLFYPGRRPYRDPHL